jgi:hypothetical protein
LAGVTSKSPLRPTVAVVAEKSSAQSGVVKKTAAASRAEKQTTRFVFIFLMMRQTPETASDVAVELFDRRI